MIAFLQRCVSLSLPTGHMFGLNMNIAKKSGMKEIYTIFLANININIRMYISTHTLLHKVKKEKDVG